MSFFSTSLDFSVYTKYYTLSIFRISAPLFTIILSFVGLYVENIAYYILLINAISASAIHVLYVNLRNREHTLLD